MSSTNFQYYSDEQLLLLIAQKNEKAFVEIYSRYADRMHYYFFRMLYQDEEQANDFTQELFLKIFEKAKQFDQQNKCSTWIYTIAANMCKNEYRRINRVAKNQDKFSTHLLQQQKQPEEQQIYLPNTIDQNLFDQYLSDVITTLSWSHRQCFVLRYQEELSIKEISEILNCPEGTVKSRLHYCLKKMSEKLRFFHPQYDPKKKESHEGKTG